MHVVLKVAISGMRLSHLIVHGLELLHARRNLILHRNGSVLLGQTSSPPPPTPLELSCRLELPKPGAQHRPQPEVWLQVAQRIGE